MELVWKKVNGRDPDRPQPTRDDETIQIRTKSLGTVKVHVASAAFKVGGLESLVHSCI